MSSIKRRYQPKQILAVGLGGIIGSVLRYGVSMILANHMLVFPWDTIIVNLCGSFLLAFIATTAIYKFKINNVLFIFLTTGIIGSFTTFSTIMVDFSVLAGDKIILAFSYLLITVLGGFILAILGFLIGKRI